MAAASRAYDALYGEHESSLNRLERDHEPHGLPACAQTRPTPSRVHEISTGSRQVSDFKRFLILITSSRSSPTSPLPASGARCVHAAAAAEAATVPGLQTAPQVTVEGGGAPSAKLEQQRAGPNTRHARTLHTGRVKGNDQVPPCVDRTFRPPGPSPPAARAAASSAAAVAGPHHCRFQQPPLPPPTGAGTAAAHLATQLAAVHFAAAAAAAPPSPPPAQEPLVKEAATQSDYRESEAQTLPWSPAYVLPAAGTPGAARLAAGGPELLALADLKWGDGLPGGWAWRGVVVIQCACACVSPACCQRHGGRRQRGRRASGF
jgi:hypothetical protein